MKTFRLPRWPRRRQTGFWFDGEWRELRDPDGPPSAHQLQRLNQWGCLEIVTPGEARPTTKGEAAAAIDEASA